MSNWRPQNSTCWRPNNGIQRSLHLCLKICLESNQLLRTQILLLCCQWPGCLWQLVEWDTSLFAYKHTKKRPLPQTGTHHYRNSEDPATAIISLSPTLFHFCVITTLTHCSYRSKKSFLRRRCENQVYLSLSNTTSCHSFYTLIPGIL